MVVRLKDLNNEQEKPRGVVRLRDLQPPEPQTNVDTSGLVNAMRSGAAPSMDVRESPIMQESAKMPGRPGRNIPVIGSVLRGLDAVADNPVVETIGEVGRALYTPGAGAANVAGLYGAARSAITRTAPGLGTSLGGRIAQEAATEAITGVPLATGQALASQTSDLGEAAKEGLIGGAVGAGLGAAAPLVRSGITRLRDLRRGTTEVTPTEVLALPEPRPRGNENAVQTPDVIYGQGTVEPLGLPEPNVSSPTRARAETRVRENPYRQQLDDLFATANEMDVPPESLRGIWERTAGPNDPRTLDELIDLAYPSNRVPSDLASRAREYQRAREVAGAPLPVRTTSDRYPQGGVTGTVDSPLTIPSRRAPAQSVQEGVEIVTPQRRFPTEQARTPIRSSGSTQPQTNERGLFRNLRESGKLTDEVQQGLKGSASRTYKPITNEATVNAANKRIAKDLDAAEDYALSGRRVLKADQVATGFRLIDEFQKSGQTERAVTIAERLAERLTQAGQSIQAASIWNRLTPEGALVAAQRIVRRVNESLPKTAKDVKIDTKTADNIRNAAAAIQRSGESNQRAGDVMAILDRMKAGETITEADRQAVMDFVKDAKQYTQPAKHPRPARVPKEMSDTRVRDRVVSFLDSQEQAALDRIKSRRNRLSSTPFDEYADYAIIGASKLAKGVVKFTDWSEQMVRELGEEIRPQLANIYNRAQDVIANNAKRVREETVSQAERIAESYLKRNETTLKPEDIELVRGLAQKVSSLSGSAKSAASQDLQALLNSFERAGIGRKISSAQYISMLLNPVTQVRNIVGNELMYRLERLSRITATPIDWAASKITGKDRQVTFSSGDWRNFFATTGDYWKGLFEGGKAGWRGVNPEGLTTSYDIDGQAFRSKLNPLTYLEKTLGAVMKGFDYASFNRTVNQRLREMAHLDAINKGIKGTDNIRAHTSRYLSNLDDNIASIAKDYGKYVTLQDDTALSRALSSFKRGANKLTTGSKEFGLGSIVLPFAKTPANLLMRAIDYSPLGFAKAIIQSGDILLRRNTDLTRADVIQSVTRALLGSGLGGVGLWLANKGVLRGESSGDRDVRELEKQAGLSQYQLNGSALQRMLGALITGNLQDVDNAAKIQPDDTFWQYEWAQPTSIPLALGANVIQERQQAARDAKKNQTPESGLKRTVDVTTGAVNTLLNTSVLQGLQQAFDLPPGEDNKFKAIATNVLKQIPGMFVPSTVSRINQAFDDSIRETYSPNFLENTLNPSRSRLPGLAQDLPQRVNTLGQPQTRENSFFDVFLSPAQRSQYKPSEEAKFVIDLMSATGEDRIAPRAVERYIRGVDPLTKQQKKIDLTGEQLVQFQTIIGQETAKRLGRINPNFSTERKVKAVLDILTEAGKVGRERMKKELGLK